MYSYCQYNYFPDEIGYIEDSPFINVNKKVTYPTWQMSSYVGAVKASTILLINNEVWEQKSKFDFVLNSVAKNYQAQGLFCYSEPKLLKEINQISVSKATSIELFQFVKQHYKWVWIYLLVLNFLIYERKLTLYSFLKSVFSNKRKFDKLNGDFETSNDVFNLEEETIDVIIPTIGRKKYLYDVLCD